MAVISPDNFDPLRRYVDVRLQMGVPLVDRDWNELADMRRFELRTLLKWFVGNGVPAGSNAFLIESTGAVDDFVIRAGASPPPAAVLAGLPDQRSKNIAIALSAGRCLVDGLEAVIDKELKFSEQPLLSAALAASLKVPPVAMPAPANGTATAYLDVWEHAVVPNDDPDNIILPGLGVESCARVKREWVVRVRMGNGVPAPGDSDYLAAHSYYALALIARRTGNGVVAAGDVTDRRERLLVPPSSLVGDLFGVSAADYSRGDGRPAVDLRRAINALLRGELPSDPETPLTIAAAPDVIGRNAVVDPAARLWAFFTRSNDVQANRFEHEAWAGEEALTTDPSLVDQNPYAIVDATGGLWLFWERNAPPFRIFFRRRPAGAAAWSPAIQVPSSPDNARTPVGAVDGTGDLWLFYTVGNEIQSQRHVAATDAWEVPEVRTPAVAGVVHNEPFVLTDSVGAVWLFYTANKPVAAVRNVYSQRRTGGIWEAEQRRSNTAGAGIAGDRTPAAVEDGRGNLWLFWQSERTPGDQHVWSSTFDRPATAWSAETALTSGVTSDQVPQALRGLDGDLWLVWEAVVPPGLTESSVRFRRRSARTATWGDVVSLTPEGSGRNRRPLVVADAGGRVWVFFQGTRAGNTNVLYRRLFPAI